VSKERGKKRLQVKEKVFQEGAGIFAKNFAEVSTLVRVAV